MSFFPMSQDAQILSNDPNSLTENYLADNYLSYKKEDVLESSSQDLPQGEPVKKSTLKWAHPRFVLSSFQLYETKTVSEPFFSLKKRGKHFMI
jgi:hypothetical protein